MYRIVVDRPTGMIRVTVSGFWTTQTAHDFLRDEQQAARSFGDSQGAHSLLVDVRQMDIQAQHVVDLLQAMADNVDRKARRFAFVCAQGLMRLQVKRAFAHRSIGVFDCEEEALAYLGGGDEAKAISGPTGSGVVGSRFP